MANNYTKFSSVFTVASPTATIARIKEIKDLLESTKDPDPDELSENIVVPDWVGEVELEYIGYELYHIEMSKEDDCRTLWVYSDDSADFAALGQILVYLIKLEPEDDLRWIIPYANTCDRLRVGEFGGGILVITKSGWGLTDTTSLLDSIIRDFGDDVIPELLGISSKAN